MNVVMLSPVAGEALSNNVLNVIGAIFRERNEMADSTLTPGSFIETLSTVKTTSFLFDDNGGPFIESIAPYSVSLPTLVQTLACSVLRSVKPLPFSFVCLYLNEVLLNI
jgi:hypothetical protein